MQLPDKTAKYFMERNDNKGCVLPFLDGKLNSGIKSELPEEGIYDNRPSRFPRSNSWPDSPDPNTAIDIDKDWIESDIHRVPDDPAGDDFYITQWVHTPDLLGAFFQSIRQIAVDVMHPALYWDGLASMSPTAFPTVILIDYIGVWNGSVDWDSLQDELKIFTLGLNLYMVSENCFVNGGTQPLVPGKDSVNTRRLFGSIGGPGSGWNGTTMYANKTVLLDTPPSTDGDPIMESFPMSS